MSTMLPRPACPSAPARGSARRAVPSRRLVRGRTALISAAAVVLTVLTVVTSRLTFGAEASYYDPRWASGTQVVAANRSVPPPAALIKVLPDGRESVVPVSGPEVFHLDDVSTDGRALLCRRESGRELIALPLGDTQTPILVRKAAGFIDQAQFSPNGRWIAYNANESGRFEVYVTAFPSKGERWQVSDNGGVQPVWRQDSRELYYLRVGTENGLWSPVWNATAARTPSSRLFNTELGSPSPYVEQYAASADGQRFLILQPLDRKVRNSLGVILNWPALMPSGWSR